MIGLVLGAVLAWASSDASTRSKGSLALPPLALVSLFALAVFAPCAAYFVAFEPDWAYAYLVDGGRRIGVLSTLVLLCDVASVPFGFVLAERAGVHAAFTTRVRLMALPLLAVAVFVIILFPRLSVQATYAQYHGDFGTRPVAGGPLGYALLWAAVVLAGATAWTAYALRRLR